MSEYVCVYMCIYLCLSAQLCFKKTKLSHLDWIDKTLLSKEMEFLEKNFLALWRILEVVVVEICKTVRSNPLMLQK